MRAVDVIMKKRDGHELSYEEIKFLIDGYVHETIEDYQMSAFCMAVFFKGMTDEETAYLTKAMLESGEELDLSVIKGYKVDKHSTGGVGDKTSLVVAPLVASLGVKTAKMSGRGLGHTGGTLDKLESIPGYNINIGGDDFIKQVQEVGVAIVGQTANLAPADKKLYSLRDVTATVDSIPLIASSIMSKKLAAGADIIHLDVKVGSGAFMKDLDTATRLAKLMVAIGKKCGKNTSAVLTNMDEPLGFAVGNSLEVIEAIDTLNGHGPKDFTELCYHISADILVDAKIAKDFDEGLSMCKKAIADKSALDRFAAMVEAQGGDKSYVYDPSKFVLGKYKKEVFLDQEGYISKIDALAIGNAAMIVGAGREKKSDDIDHSVGIVLTKKVGDYVKKSECVATIYSNKEDVNTSYDMTNNAFKVGSEVVTPKLILKSVR